ncbi:MAG: AAA family ATPase [Lachnospiraceae bacterium]|nr:AAA family ATPase [Lachnospiraceae bacterium]
MKENGLRKLPIGVQDFQSLREDGFVYVDKTEYIYRLTRGSRQCFLLRPRRFGKSLLLSTMQACWEGRKELFTGLAIERLVEGDDLQICWIIDPKRQQKKGRAAGGSFFCAGRDNIGVVVPGYNMWNMNEKVLKLKENMERRIVGKGEVIEKVIIALLAGGHLLLEDVPGVGKTSLAKALADSMALTFARIQCTPDTTPSDIAGFSFYRQAEGKFEISPGPVVNNIVLADELNRTSPKTQSALLEVMEEHKVTIDGKAMAVPEPFMVIGTQNPAEMAGTYPLPESQLDRFLMKLSLGYPDARASEDMAERFLAGQLHGKTEAVLTSADLLAMRDAVGRAAIHKELMAYAVKIVEATRNKAEIACGASPRALLAMLRCAQAISYMADRAYCIPEDIAEAAYLTLPHRLMLTTGAKLSHVTNGDLVKTILGQVKAS